MKGQQEYCCLRASVKKGAVPIRNKFLGDLGSFIFNKLKMKTEVFETVYSSIVDTLVVPSVLRNTTILETFFAAKSLTEKDKIH